MVPSGKVAVVGTFSGSEVTLAGILKAAQCSTSLVVRCRAVSGSSTIRAKLWVPAGALLQASSGEIGLGTAWVYLSGMMAPSWKEVLVRPMGVGGGPAGAAAGCAKPKLLLKESMTAPSARFFRLPMMVPCCDGASKSHLLKPVQPATFLGLVGTFPTVIHSSV